MVRAKKSPSRKRSSSRGAPTSGSHQRPLFTLPAADHMVLMSHIEYGSARGHWLYNGYINKGGYGVYLWNAPDGRRYFINVHRYVWEHHYGVKIKRGYELDHLCHVTNCCRPMKPHLEEVTKSVNLSRRRF